VPNLTPPEKLHSENSISFALRFFPLSLVSTASPGRGRQTFAQSPHSSPIGPLKPSGTPASGFNRRDPTNLYSTQRPISRTSPDLRRTKCPLRASLGIDADQRSNRLQTRATVSTNSRRGRPSSNRIGVILVRQVRPTRTKTQRPSHIRSHKVTGKGVRRNPYDEAGSGVVIEVAGDLLGFGPTTRHPRRQRGPKS